MPQIFLLMLSAFFSAKAFAIPPISPEDETKFFAECAVEYLWHNGGGPSEVTASYHFTNRNVGFDDDHYYISQVLVFLPKFPNVQLNFRHTLTGPINTATETEVAMLSITDWSEEKGYALHLVEESSDLDLESDFRALINLPSTHRIENEVDSLRMACRTVKDR